jgi:TonB-linked SusC/RagA family outer membrane protein
MKKVLLLILVCLTSVGMTYAQVQKVMGIVTSSEDGEPIVGASVLVVGTTLGSVTNLDGAFEINGVPADAKKLSVSYIGMQSRTVDIKPGKLTIVLNPDTEVLDEVMVVAYGTTKRSAFTGSAAVLDQDKIQTPAASVDKSLAGQLAGVQVLSSGGQPGSSTSFRVRGSGSLNASNEPLIVVDGVATSNMEYSQVAYNNSSSSNILSSLNSDDIESITVLKDAAAAALYGSRAANGVILVTTKSGKAGKTKVSLDAKFSWANLGESYDLMNSAQYYKTLFGYYNSLGKGSDWANEQTQGAITHNPYNVDYPLDANGNVVSGAQIVVDTDWQKEVFSTAATQDYSLSVSGGNDKATHFFSVGYLDQDGIAPAAGFKRYSAKMNIDAKATPWLKAGLNANFSHSIQNTTVAGSAGASPLYNSLSFPAGVPIYVVDKNGTPVLDADGNKQYNYTNPVSIDFNPMSIPYMDINRTKTYRLIASAYLELEPVKDVKLKTVFSPDFITNNEHRYWNKEHGNGKSYNGRLDKYHTTDLMYTSTNTLSYSHLFADRHQVNAMVGMEYWKSNYEYLYAAGRDLLGDMQELDVAAGSYSPSSLTTKEVLISYFGRAEYAFDDKYNASLSIRRDGSSVFGTDTKWGTFWSAGFSWRMKEENFLKDVEWIDNLKLRASYGTSGNKAGLDRYQSMGLWTVSSSYKYDTYNGALLTQLANSSLGWEKQKMFNIAVDFSLWNRFYGSIDYFYKVSDGLLYSLPISSETGLTGITMNAAKTANYGVEVMLGAQILRDTPLKWNMELNASFIKDKIKDLYGDDDIQQTTYQKIWSVGGSQYEFYMPTWAGVDESNGQPLWYKVDSNGERTTTSVYGEATKERQGRSTPDVYGGFTNKLSYKNFDLSIQLNYQFGGKVYDGLYQNLMNGSSTFSSNMHVDNLNAWTETNTHTNVPKIGANAASSSLSSRFLYDASYIKVKNITLSYTLPRIKGWSDVVSSARVFVSTDNLATWFMSDYQGYSDLDIYGVQGYRLYPAIPTPKTWTLGVNVTF